MPSEIIQGIEVHWRDLEHGEDILYENLPQEEQYFRRAECPFSDDDLLAIAAKELAYTGYTPTQKSWVDRENKRFEEGLYAYINGKLTFIPGAYWCYVNFWTLEHGEKPEYREDDRKFFLFHEYLRLKTNSLGILRLKGRRQGATSIAMFFMWFIGGRKSHSLCGLTSFNDQAAQDAFQRMFMYGFKAMLPCFQEDFDSDSENFIRFVKPVEKKKKGVLAVKREGLNSYCDYKPNLVNSYDSGRQTYNCIDESGKRNKVNINSYWSRLSKTLVIGINKVGFAYSPTTVGAKKEGGENFKLFYANSNQHTIDKSTGKPVGLDTPTRCVQYFVPATHCYAGCIDKFGNSVIDDPEEPVMGNDGRWIKEGARTLILRDRKKLKDEQLMEHRRDYPLDVFDAFSFEAGTCEFNEKRLTDRIAYLEENPEEAFWRQGRLYEEYDAVEKRILVKWADDDSGDCWIKEFPEKPNNYSVRGGFISALNELLYSGGADTYKNIFAVNGSDGAICVFKKSQLNDKGEEVGLYPVFFFEGRPRLIKQFNRIAFLVCLYFGCKINYEIDAGTWFYEDFMEWNALELLEWTPAVDPTKPNFKITPGTESANPFQLAKQLEVAKLYFDGNSITNYNGNGHRVTYIPLLKQALGYNHEERTPYHTIVCFMMALLPVFAKIVPAKSAHQVQPRNILPTFKIKMNQN
jgi:hypothetical protein